MSSARRIVEGAGSLWSDIAPLLPSYVRRINLGDYDRELPPMKSKSEPRRQFILNDAAFDLAADHLRGGSSNAETMLSDVVTKWRGRFHDVAAINDVFSRTETQEVRELAQRLAQMLHGRRREITNFNITLHGLGRLENVEVDLYGPMLVGEVKAGARSFRSIDFRQLILACVVEGPSSGGRNLLLLNPREGIIWGCVASEFVEAISLMPFAEFINEFRYVLSEVGMSN